MSALEQLWNGISPCMEPGVGDCVVWWDAWAVVAGASAVGIAIGALIVAWVGVGVTTASAFAVWKLGIAANAASSEATRIAAAEATRSGDESTRRAFREETEELLALIQVHGEVALALGIAKHVVRTIEGGGIGKQLFLAEERFRQTVFVDVSRLEFPMVASAMDRMHFLDRKVSGCLLRAVAVAKLAQETYRFHPVEGATPNYADVYESLSSLLPPVCLDLEAVMVACELAVKRMGISVSMFQSEGSSDLEQ